MSHDIPIVHKTYDFYREVYLVIEKMPKKDKYTLGEKIQKITLDLLELLIEAIASQHKLELLSRASVKLDLLKLFVRLAHELKAMNTKKYLLLEEKLQEIGRMLGGWLRSVR